MEIVYLAMGLSKSELESAILESPKSTRTVKRRYKELRNILSEDYGWGWDVKLAICIALSEEGYSTGGMAKVLLDGGLSSEDKSRSEYRESLEGTVENWHEKAREEFGNTALETFNPEEQVSELNP